MACRQLICELDSELSRWHPSSLILAFADVFASSKPPPSALSQSLQPIAEPALRIHTLVMIYRSLQSHLFLVALGAPIALLAIGALFRPGGLMPWEDPSLLLANWLYMAFPSILAMLIALAVRKARGIFLRAALLTLTGLLVTYQLWVWVAVPVQESALAWVLYHPAAAIVMAAVGLGTAAHNRRGGRQ